MKKENDKPVFFEIANYLSHRLQMNKTNTNEKIKHDKIIST
jgi:hypothetical protein